MTSITFGHVGRGTAAPDRRRARVTGEVFDRNTHRAAGWAIAVTATLATWGGIGGAVYGLISLV